MTEAQWDKLLKIRTTGRDDSHSDRFRYPYEPTPYNVLERLAGSGYLTKKNTLLDYGCGKGRVGFFLGYQVGCKVLGVEADDWIYPAGLENLSMAVSSSKVSLEHADAGYFNVPAFVDRCFFFNPFSVEILKKVMPRILTSWYDVPREVLLFFYYPSDEYISYLMTVPELDFLDEIDCKDLSDQEDERERIILFELENRE